MMRLSSFAPAHLLRCEWQVDQAPFQSTSTDPRMLQWAQQGWAVTGWDEDGEIIGCAGLAPAIRADDSSQDCALAWAVFTDRMPKHIRAITRLVRDVLAEYPIPSVYAYVAQSHVKAARWAEALGFTAQSTVENVLPGRDVVLYLRKCG